MSRIILCGPSCGGKIFISEKLQNAGYKLEVSYTSRPIRKGEKHHKDYIFLSKDEFKCMIEDGEFFEWVEYNGNYYGTGKKQFKKSDIFVWETDGIEHLSPKERKESTIIYVNTPVKIRMNRMYKRGWKSEEIHKRIKTDIEKFKNFKNFDIEIQSFNE